MPAHPRASRPLLTGHVQTNQARLLNDLTAGTTGGFVGTALNTPYVPARSAASPPVLTPRPQIRRTQRPFIHRARGLPLTRALPLQVVKSRIQGATKAPGVVPKYSWTYPACVPPVLLLPPFAR